MTIINPYGTEWHEELEKENDKCLQCGSHCNFKFILSERGYADVSGFCSTNCLTIWIVNKFFKTQE